MAKAKKYFNIASGLYFLALLIDTGWELFHVKFIQSDFINMNTLLGITIYKKITSNESIFYFHFGMKALIIFLIFIGSVLLSILLLEERQNKLHYQQ